MIRSLCLALACLVPAGLAWTAPAEKPDPAIEKYHTANSMTMRRLYKLAITHYREFLTTYPDHEKVPQVRWGLAICLYSTGAFQEAESILADLAGKPAIKDQEQLHNIRGACLIELGKPAEAERAFAWTVEHGTKPARRADALASMMEVLTRQKKWKELAQHADMLAAQEGAEKHHALALYQGGLARLEMKAYEEAAGCFQKLIDAGTDPDLVHRAHYQLGECAERRGDLKAAPAHYAAAAKQKGGAYADAAAYKIGAVRILSGEAEAGLKDLQNFLRSAPKSPLAPYARLYSGRGCVETNRFSEGEKHLRPLVDGPEPPAAEARLWLARALAGLDRQQKKGGRKGKTDRRAAIADLLRDAPTRYPDSPLLPELRYELAVAEMNRERFAEAAEAFAAVPDGRDELTVEARRLQAFCLHRAGKHAESVKLCDAFLAAHKDHAKASEIRFLKAEGLFQLGRKDEALAIHRGMGKDAAGDAHRHLAALRLAKEAYDGGDWAGCLDRLAPLLDLKTPGPAFAQVHFMAGDCCLRREQWDGAIGHLERFVKEHPTQPNADTAQFNLALAYQKAGRAQDATRVLATLARKPSKGKNDLREHNPQAYAEFCRVVYEHERDRRRKVEFLSQAAKQNIPEAHYYLAWVHVQEKRDADAIKHFGEVLRRPDHALAFDAGLQRSILQIRAEAFAEAAKTLDPMAKRHATHAKIGEVLFYRGLCLARLEKLDDAVRDFTTVMEQHPESAVAGKAVYWRAWCERRRKNPAEAARLLALLETDPPAGAQRADAQLELAEMDLVKKHYAGVVARLQPLADDRKLCDANPDVALRVDYLLGWAHWRAGRPADAAKAFERLLGRKGGDPARVATAAFQAGEARMAMRDYRNALRHFTRAEETSRGSSSHAAALLRLAQVLDLDNKVKESHAAATRFLEAYPESALAPQAHFCIGWSFERRKQYAEAVAAYERVLAGGLRDETAAKAHFQIGECLFAQEQFDAAMTQFTRVETRYRLPKYTSKAVLEIGRILERQENLTRAQERYREVLSRFPDSTAAPVAKQLLARVTEKLQRRKKK